MKRAAAVLFAIVCLLTARPSAAGTSWTHDEWEDAQAMHANRCAQCHRLYDPKDYSEEEWSGWLKKMKRQARLSLKETRQLSEYTHALRQNDKFEFKRREAETPEKSTKPKRVLRPVGL